MLLLSAGPYIYMYIWVYVCVHTHVLHIGDVARIIDKIIWICLCFNVVIKEMSHLPFLSVTCEKWLKIFIAKTRIWKLR